MAENRDLKALPLAQLKAVMAELGEKPFRAAQLYDWRHVKLAESYDEMTNLPAAFREKLKAEYPLTVLKAVREHQLIGGYPQIQIDTVYLLNSQRSQNLGNIYVIVPYYRNSVAKYGQTF